MATYSYSGGIHKWISDGSGTEELNIQATGYPSRDNYYPTYGYPQYTVLPGEQMQFVGNFMIIRTFGFEGYAGNKIKMTTDGTETTIKQGLICYDAVGVNITGRPVGDYDFDVDIEGSMDYLFRIGDMANRFIAIGTIGRCKDISIDRIYAKDIWYGVQAKTDPKQDSEGGSKNPGFTVDGCDHDYMYNETTPPGWMLDNISIHHCYFENISQDCIYAGNTDPIGDRTYTCNGVTGVHFIPLRMSNVSITHNRIHLVGRTAIQLSGCDRGYNEILYNHITNTGDELNQSQGTGISLGHTANCRVAYNYIDTTFIFGIFDIGIGSNLIEYNTVINQGKVDLTLDSGGYTAAGGTGGRASYVAANPDNQFLVVGDILYNQYALGSADNITIITKPSEPFTPKRVTVRYNILGANHGKYDQTGCIAFQPYGPDEEWSGTNNIYGNTKLDGKKVTIKQYTSDPTFPLVSQSAVDILYTEEVAGKTKLRAL